ncbi:hypothetical protein [Providencia rustigianii]|uniref:Uncharacterized protein n=2 Tax=Providencia rustigianii TaxID=158850 RepID=D1P1A0_9GAMM|nr:hypothetical protein [Providencia rustigianii]EFB73119.1 hypothetical protein PROVRUST_05918 [Providencia rustigianii DSM 4541]SUC25144.1 Uncharacterised protein [Providencia rustigianii]
MYGEGRYAPRYFLYAHYRGISSLFAKINPMGKTEMIRFKPTVITFAAFLLNACSLGTAPSNPPDPNKIKIACEQRNGTGVLIELRITLNRDMSSLSTGFEEYNLYSSSAKDSTWKFKKDLAHITVRKDNDKFLIDSSHDGYGYTCTLPKNETTNSISARDYKSENALKDEKIVKEYEDERRKLEIKNKPIMDRAKKQCSMYLSDLKTKYTFNNAKITHVSSGGSQGITVCVIMAEDPIYKYYHTIIVTGRGQNYEYRIN